MSWLRPANLALAILAVLAPVAHVLELPNKFALDATAWLVVQQHLYRGWGPFLGAPSEIGALATSLVLAYMRRRNRPVLLATALACMGYIAMLATFFTLNAPVNAAVAAWTAASVPADWTGYRLRWESGHALAALLAVLSATALIWARGREKPA